MFSAFFPKTLAALLERSTSSVVGRVLVFALLAVGFPAYPAMATAWKTGALSVGSEIDYPPYMIVDKEGHPSGFAVELLREVCKQVNLRPKFEVGTFSVLRKKLESGEITIIPLMAKSNERANQISFSETHSIGYDAIFVRDRENTIQSEDDLEGKKIIVQKGDYADDKLSEKLRQAVAKTGSEPFTLVYSSSVTEGFKILLANGGDAFIGSQVTALLALQKIEGSTIRLAEKPMMNEYSREYAFGIRKGDRELVNRLNEGLKSVIASGEYSRIYDKWFSGLDPAIREREQKAHQMMQLAIGLGLAILVAFIALTMVVVFRREVNRKARSLAESELRFRNLVTNLPGVVFSCECRDFQFTPSNMIASVKGDFKITYISDFVEKLTGYSAQTFIGCRPDLLVDLVHREDRDNVAMIALDNLQKMQRTEMDFRILRRDGTVRWIQARAAAPTLDRGGQRAVINGIFFDITETKRISDLLSQQQSKMAASARLSALGEMAGGIAHEINNPLAIINLRTHQLTQLARKGPVRPDDANMVATGIEATAQRISKIVRSLQKVSRETEGDPFENVAIREIIDETFELCYQRMLNNGINVTLGDFPSGLTIECRRVQISQVLINILNNAFDAVLGRTEKTVKLEVQDLGERVELSISNSGPQIPPELAHKIFQPFFTTKGVGKGTGLGLSISKGLIESHGGDISLDLGSSETRFVILLPKKQAKRTHQASPSPLASGSSEATNLHGQS